VIDLNIKKVNDCEILLKEYHKSNSSKETINEFKKFKEFCKKIYKENQTNGI
jgi:hypothetical protein